jgi:8-oxo-dGTP pyrophosphatase MutT (NUDIX family)
VFGNVTRGTSRASFPVVRTGVEVAVFATRKRGSEVLIVHRSPEQGGYWHVVAGGMEPGEAVEEAAERELREETALVANVATGSK